MPDVQKKSSVHFFTIRYYEREKKVYFIFEDIRRQRPGTSADEVAARCH